MPKIADIEYTPNPNAVKFILKEPVTSGASRSFQNAESAQADPLAAALFAVGNVTSVFYMDRFVTVNKEDEVSWEEMLKKLAEPIRAAPSASESPAEVQAADLHRPAITRCLTGSIRSSTKKSDRDWRATAEDLRSSG